ncbi:MAG: hypothetical protein NT050_01940, partial [Verrucomicrobia bacterium]|nr:hypothetical protein [Verrucomicrobiota bacterium]
ENCWLEGGEEGFLKVPSIPSAVLHPPLRWNNFNGIGRAAGIVFRKDWVVGSLRAANGPAPGSHFASRKNS